MSTQPGSPKPSPAFPFKPSKPQARQLAAALLVDSLANLGLGLPSTDVEQSALQSWYWGFGHDFGRSLQERFGSDACSVFERCFVEPPAVDDADSLDPFALIATRTRVLACYEMAASEASKSTEGVSGNATRTSPTTSEPVLWSMFRQAVFASQRLAYQSATPPRCLSAKVVGEIMRQRWKLKVPLAWSVGLVPEDVRAVVSQQLLGPQDIYEDFRAWCGIVLRERLGDPQNFDGLDVDAARRAIVELVESRAFARMDQFSRVLSSLEALRDLEHEIVEDSRIDSVFADLRIDEFVRVPLGSRGHLELASPLRGRGVAKTEHQLREMLELLERGHFKSDPSSDPKPDPNVQKLINDRLYEASRNAHPITLSRVFLAWRGGPGSAEVARVELPALLRSAVRTAWLAMIRHNANLEYFADSRWVRQSFDGRGAPIEPGWTLDSVYPISTFPENYPVQNWIQDVLGQVVLESPSASDAIPSTNAVRLLSSADALRHVDPARAFLCATTAIEVGLGGKGSDLSERVSRRMARLLIPELSGRARAIEVFRSLYDIRSRIAHGDDYRVSVRQAVFMQYVASCVTYSLCGSMRTAKRLGNPSSLDDVRKALDAGQFTADIPIGAERHPFLVWLVAEPAKLADWVGAV
jgi:hypothetical protein